ncbi:hypothetical protein ADP71_28440 [Vitreoscilla sp. C1]|uniref:DUF4129 domain-containing protein n=1 Tax=Vitreoscilla sp. (strain C1) TaxID=96942 RepID=UPI00148EABE4|nr:DUF4129 domain-containing protein [Vitreoscilla sp. C1]AUZ06083.2 hypothetical protein ADP71_28440 [Vitreoscilla sp. C1]
MNLSQSRLKFRQRTPWEAADLGRRLINEHLGYYTGLYAALTLPILLIGVLLFWGDLFWLSVWLWWLKPLAEYGILSVLSIHAFDTLPPWKTALKNGFALMFKRQIIGDLTWRRWRLTRSFHLPIQQLEQLSGKEYRQRQRELGRYGNTTASTLTIFGNALENTWMYAIMILAYWFLYGNFIEQGLVQPSQMDQLQHLFIQIFSSWHDGKANDFLNYTALAYFVTLSFWGPFYVASGFTLYLNARVQTEAWDIRLIWQQLRERLRGGVRWHFAWVLALFLTLHPTDIAYAQSLPDAAQVEQNRQEVLENSPYFHIQEEKKWCWLSCDDDSVAQNSPAVMPSATTSGGTLIQFLGYALLLALIAAAVWGLHQWRLNLLANARARNEMDTPSHLFGLDLRQETLPKNVSQHVLSLAATDPRAALSVLYRASLAQLLKQNLPIQEHYTESQVLQLVKQRLPLLNAFFQALTQAWLYTAYGHHNASTQDIHNLCQQYAQHFEVGKSS